MESYFDLRSCLFLQLHSVIMHCIFFLEQKIIYTVQVASSIFVQLNHFHEPECYQGEIPLESGK